MQQAQPGGEVGRVDTHSHLLPSVDDGCQSLEESLSCARRLVEAGYTHSFCTPHIWPSFPENNVRMIPRRVASLQGSLDEAAIPLRLFPGGEINLREDTAAVAFEDVVSFGMAREFVLIDLWADRLPAYFRTSVRHLQAMGLTVILAHPERMRAVQYEPGLADLFAEMGVLLQGNLQCLGDPPDALTRIVAEQYLREGRYFMLGTDLHNPGTLPVRMRGLARAIELVGTDQVWSLTRENPRRLVPDGAM